jgi:hypothetical protein
MIYYNKELDVYHFPSFEHEIKDPVEKTRAILKELGADGQAEYRKLTDEVKKYTEEQSKSSEAVRLYQANSKAAMDMLGGWVVSAKDAVGDFFGWFGEKFAVASNAIAGLFGQSVSKELLDNIAEGEARIDKMQKTLDKKREEAVKATRRKINRLCGPDLACGVPQRRKCLRNQITASHGRPAYVNGCLRPVSPCVKFEARRYNAGNITTRRRVDVHSNTHPVRIRRESVGKSNRA